MIKAAAYIILLGVAFGAVAGIALDTYLGDPIWLLLGLAFLALDAAWKWFRKQRKAAKQRAARANVRAPFTMQAPGEGLKVWDGKRGGWTE